MTDPEVTRYFMTIEEAVRLVIQAAAIGADGEALVLDMGEPVSIDAVARQLIEMSGKDLEVPAAGDALASPRDDEGWRTLRETMTDGAGLVRSADSLRDAAKVLTDLEASEDEGLHLASVAAGLICGAALQREESRGVHFRSDHPSTEPSWDGRHIELRNVGTKRLPS